MSSKLKTLRSIAWVLAAISLINSSFHCYLGLGGGVAFPTCARIPLQKHHRLALQARRPKQEGQTSGEKNVDGKNPSESMRLGLAVAAAISVAAASPTAPAQAFGFFSPFSPFGLFSPLNPISPISPLNPLSPISPFSPLNRPTVIYDRGNSEYSQQQQRQITELRKEVDNLRHGQGQK